MPFKRGHLVPVLLTGFAEPVPDSRPSGLPIPHFLAPVKERSPGTLPAPALTHQMIWGKSPPSLCPSFPTFLMQGKARGTSKPAAPQRAGRRAGLGGGIRVLCAKKQALRHKTELLAEDICLTHAPQVHLGKLRPEEDDGTESFWKPGLESPQAPQSPNLPAPPPSLD